MITNKSKYNVLWGEPENIVYVTVQLGVYNIVQKLVCKGIFAKLTALLEYIDFAKFSCNMILHTKFILQ